MGLSLATSYAGAWPVLARAMSGPDQAPVSRNVEKVRGTSEFLPPGGGASVTQPVVSSAATSRGAAHLCVRASAHIAHSHVEP